MIRAIRYGQTDQPLIKKSFTIKIKHQEKPCFFLNYNYRSTTTKIFEKGFAMS